MILRPNYAQDAPPTSVEVGGFAYPVRVDFRVWAEAVVLLEDWIDQPANDDQLQHNAAISDRVQHLVFGGVLAEEEPGEVLSAIAEFARGYPTAAAEEADASGEPLYSLVHDMNAIVIAIRNQTGLDLSYRRKEPFHWWEFLLEFQTLCGDHYILNLMEARGYRGDDPELLRRRRMCALPARRRAEDAARIEEINQLFYNA